MKYYRKENELYVDPIVSNHDGLVEITEEEFNTQLEINNTPTDIEIQNQLNEEARTYLAETDLYVIRFQENGTLIPVEISTKRQEAREVIVNG